MNLITGDFNIDINGFMSNSHNSFVPETDIITGIDRYDDLA